MNLSKLENDFKNISDDELTKYLQDLLQQEKQIGDSILLALKEIKTRRIYAGLGYSSLFEMLVKHFHLSETSSYQRLNALKLMESVPAAAKEIFQGDLSLTNAAALQSFILRSEKEQNKPMTIHQKIELINEVKNKSTKEAQQILATINPTAVIPKQKEKVITEKLTQLQILVDQETLSQFKQVQSLLSHSIPDGDYNQILKIMTQEMIVILQKRKGIYNKELAMNTDGDNTYSNNNIQPTTLTKATGKSSQMTEKLPPMAVKQSVKTTDQDISTKIGPKNISANPRYISAEIKKVIFSKAQNRCQYISNTGHRCNSQHQLEIDHIQPISRGGNNHENNLRVLCRAHNQYRIKHTHGFWFRTVK